MSQIRLDVDEDASQHSVIDGLRSRDVDVLTASEAGMDGATDEDQLRFATSQTRSSYTLNVPDYCRLHADLLAKGKSHAGIILIPRQRYSIGEKIRRLAHLVDSVSGEEMQNRLEFL